MSKFINQIRKPASCYTCTHNCIINEDADDEWWGCDELYGVPVGTNPPYDEPCDFYNKDHERFSKLERKEE